MQSVTTPTKRYRIMVDMPATLIHYEHIRLLRKAAELGDVVVALTSDAEVKSKKDYTPELNFAERKEILEAVKYVTEVVERPWLITEDFVNEHHCDLLVHGSDNVNPIDPKRLVIFPRTEGVSSSTLRERVFDCLIEMNVTGKSGSASEKLARFMIEAIKKEFRLE